MKYDFAGWVTKNDILCTDGVTIKHDAFKGNDQAKVPLVWNHDHSSPENVLGHVILHNQAEGVYGYGIFNDTPAGQNAKTMVQNGDIVAMSIAANRIKKQGTNVVHGNIFEVSLVLAGANAGAIIDTVMTHADSDEETIHFENGLLIHSADSDLDNTIIGGTDTVDKKDEKDLKHAEEDERTIGDILETLDEDQMAAVEALVAQVATEAENGDGEDLEQSDDLEGDKVMKHNVFDKAGETLTGAENTAGLRQAATDVLISARDTKANSLKELLAQDETLKHSITDIESLFPDPKLTTNEPQIWMDTQTGAAEILAGTKKEPFSRLKSRFADLTADEARANGYIKGDEKIEQIFDLLGRETSPQTIYKKQKLDRDDIIDITDFDIVAFLWKEMRMMLIEEVGRAILVGDGRETTSRQKIKEDKIRPIISDDNFYTLKANYTDATDLVESIMTAMDDYKGAGSPTAFIDPALLTQVKLLKGTDGRYLRGYIPSDSALADEVGIGSFRRTTLMKGKGVLIVNLRDYSVGSTKGGEITTFDDFDIDFNQYKYLIETRLSGSLMTPHSAIYLSKKA